MQVSEYLIHGSSGGSWVGELPLTSRLSIKGVGLSELSKKILFGATWYSLSTTSSKQRGRATSSSQYEETLGYSDLAIPDEDKPKWAKHS